MLSIRNPWTLASVGLPTRIFRNCKTTAEKIEAVTQYFHTNYTYSLGLAVPADQDPLTYFLEEASTGYCEYFASGAAVLLRLADVPTRYVTGFLVTERDEDGKSWVARNMDAHAWVEAWDRETTPGSSSRPRRRTTWQKTRSGIRGWRTAAARGCSWPSSYRRCTTTACWACSAGSSRFTASGPQWKCRWLSLGPPCGWPCCDAVAKSHRSAVLRAARSPELLALHRMLAAVDRKAKVNRRPPPAARDPARFRGTDSSRVARRSRHIAE